jgi:DNA-binding MarR family transcriptional regulator
MRLSCGEIAERMIARDPDVTRLVDRLSRRGLVSRSRGRTDRRIVEVGITDKGRELLRTLDPYVNRMPPAMIGHLGADKLKQLKRLLEHLISGLGTFP